MIISLSSFYVEKTDDGYERQFQVNYLSHFLITLHLLPLLRESAPNSRVINVSSTAHSSGTFDLNNMQSEVSYSRLKSYNNSKLYQVSMQFQIYPNAPYEKVLLQSVPQQPIQGDMRQNTITSCYKPSASSIKCDHPPRLSPFVAKLTFALQVKIGYNSLWLTMVLDKL